MVKHFFLIILYSIITFCVVSYLSVMISLFSTVGSLSEKPVANLGFPFNYYYQFWLRGNDGPNCGWIKQNFVIDFFVVWVCCSAVYIFKEKKSRGA